MAPDSFENRADRRPGLWSATRRVFMRDLMLATRRSTDVLNPIIFFVIVISLFPLGIGPEPNQLRLLGPGIIWVAALLATMLSLNRMFASDFDNGILELMAISPQPLTLLVFSKIVAHWVLTGLPLVLLTPLLGHSLYMPGDTIAIMMLTLLLGTPTLSLVGAIGAGLTLGLRGGGVLVSLLVLPLYTPVLIFGAGAVTASAQGFAADAQLSLLGALLALALSLAPVAAATAVRISLD